MFFRRDCFVASELRSQTFCLFAMTDSCSGYKIPLLWRGGENSQEFLTAWFLK